MNPRNPAEPDTWGAPSVYDREHIWHHRQAAVPHGRAAVRLVVQDRLPSSLGRDRSRPPTMRLRPRKVVERICSLSYCLLSWAPPQAQPCSTRPVVKNALLVFAKSGRTA